MIQISTLIFYAFVFVFIVQLVVALWLEYLNTAQLKKYGDLIPAPFDGYVASEKLSKIQVYSIDNSQFFAISKIATDMLVLALIVTGGLSLFDLYHDRAAETYITAGLVYFFASGLFFYITELPFDYYHTFVLEEKHGFNKSDLQTWMIDHAKSAAVSAILLLILAAPLLWTISAFPHSWWLFAFILVSGIQLILVVLYPILIAPLFNKFEPLDDQVLTNRVEQLVKTVGMQPNGVFQMDAGKRSSHSNAYFTGLGKTKRIVLFDTLLDSHSNDEILAVLAHELGHFKLKHIMKMYALSLLISLVAFYFAYLVLNWSSAYEAFSVPQHSSYILLFILGIFFQKLSFFAGPLKSAMSRKFEREADNFASKLVGPQGLVGALRKLALENLSNLHPHRIYVFFYYSHPPVVERILQLESFKGGDSCKP